ncbi:hypothetical protein MIND_00973000 [Mycena indigotica]|uniref:Uncharacterized protein n=1 Tax=Mycena indigotica TaxID=2126181 RepID=A0A8H6SDF4_9AGAR|nr:uncharacterized protein MIND_00973000 [Mycena indigotica]KAF7297394.1 hypothetical protein MIND_00973000 [Mycena indigotica]
MSTAEPTGPLCAIGIYRAPASDPETNNKFRSEMKKFMHDAHVLPASKNNLLKLNVVYQNDELQESGALSKLGFPPAPATVVVTVEAKTKQDMLKCLEDSDLCNLVWNGASFGLQDGACVFSADIVTKIDQYKSPKGHETCHGLFVFKIPSEYHFTVGEYHKKIEDMVDKFIALPIAQQHLVKHTIWLQNQELDEVFRHWRMPDPEKTVVLMLECDTWESMNELLTDDHIQRIIHEANADFKIHEDSNCFTGDVVNLLYEY